MSVYLTNPQPYDLIHEDNIILELKHKLIFIIFKIVQMVLHHIMTMKGSTNITHEKKNIIFLKENW